MPSETIEVIEGGEYFFEIIDDNETNFCSCDYKSNLDLDWTTFPINKPNNACVEVTTPVPPVTFLKNIVCSIFSLFISTPKKCYFEI